jgi:hypothetical protein
MSFRRKCSALVIVVSCLAAAVPVAARAVTAAAAGPAQHAVSFEGVSLQVPASWPVVNLSRHPDACPRLDVHAVYLGTPGPDPACPASLQGKVASVIMQPVNTAGPDVRQATRRVVIGGHRARTNTDARLTHTIIDILPSAGVEVSLSYGTSRALVASIERTISISGQAKAIRLATPAAIKPAAPQGVVRGPGFDTCAAPSAGTMKHWLASPYRSVGIYIGGLNRGCSQPNLTSGWIKTIQGQGWHYFPFYVGLQAPCVAGFGNATIKAGSAAAEGRAAADDAVKQAADLGIPSGTPLIYDMEGYRSGCSATVTTFLSAWDSELHAKGYVAGIYESFSNISDLIGAANRMTEPDVIHYADWDGRATTRSSYMPSNRWTSHQRIHQYRGGHNESHGGVTVNIDNDQLDVSLSGAPVGGGGGGRFRPAFKIAVAINSNGSAEWFAKAANDTVRHNYQYKVNTPGWSATRTVGNSPGNLVSNPAVTSNANGDLTLFARTRTGRIVHAWQHPGAPNGWRWAGAVGMGKPSPAAVGDPGAIRAHSGAVAVFVTTAGGKVLTTRQNAANANSGWSGWARLGGDCASSPRPFVDSSQTLEVFCTTTKGTLAVDAAGQGGWHGWQTIGGGPAALTGTPSAASDSSGQTDVFASTKSGRLGFAAQHPGGAWTWRTSPARSTKIRNSPSAISWPGGGVGVFARMASGAVGYAAQRGSGSASWSGWTSLSRHIAGSPTAWENTNGNPEVVVLTKALQIAVSTLSASRWSSWTRLGGGY